MNHYSQISSADISKSATRFILLQGASLILQTLFALLPIIFLRDTHVGFMIFMVTNFVLGGTAVIFAKQINKLGTNHILPFIGVATCTIGIALEFVSPGIMIFMAAWVLLITLGERREYYTPNYLITFMVFTTGCIAMCVLFLPDENFPNAEMALTLIGGFLLSLINIYFIYLELLKKKEKPGNTQDRTYVTLDRAMEAILKAEESLENTLWRVSRECIPLLGLEDCVIYLYDHSSEKLMQVAAYGNKTPDGSEIILDPIEIIPGNGVVGECFSSGKTMHIDNLREFEGYIIDDEQRSSELAVPIINRGEVIGVIDSEHSQPSFFTEEHVKAFESLAHFCATKYAAMMKV